MTSRCLEPEDALVLLEPVASRHDDAAAIHAEVCPECAALVSDLRRVRDVARRIGSSAWADVPPLDVERALRRVRARALLVPSERGARVPQVLSAAAAAFLLCALVGPYLLRQRVEGDPAGEAGFRPRAERVVFWTTAPTTALALMRE